MESRVKRKSENLRRDWIGNEKAPAKKNHCVRKKTANLRSLFQRREEEEEPSHSLAEASMTGTETPENQQAKKATKADPRKRPWRKVPTEISATDTPTQKWDHAPRPGNTDPRNARLAGHCKTLGT